MNKSKLLFTFVIFLLTGILFGIENEECLECHSDPELTTERGNKEISMHVNNAILKKSIHKDLDCVSCHVDADVEELPHEEVLEKVNCGECHDDEQLNFDAGIHGYALKQKMNYAPDCIECHGKHDILSPKDPKSISYKMKIPFLCGKCHREGAPVARVYDITEHNIIENYSQSIHGEGLLKKGLIVTAACIDCHRSHMILPHTNSKSSTSFRNIAQTCMQCHSRIEDVHKQVIEGEKWEADPGAIPACTDCHLPHKARKASQALNLSDQACLKCHENKEIHKIENNEKISLYVSKETIKTSIHKGVPCVKCHSDVNPKLHRPCETAASANCGSCHEKYSEEYWEGGHGKGVKEGVKDSPKCITCHGYHDVKSHTNEDAQTFRASIPALCGNCHSKDSRIKETKLLAEPNAFFDYSKSIHGIKLTEKGLLPSANCTDCHSAHLVLNQKDARSSVYKKNIPATCANCHRGIYKDYIKSVHFSVDDKKMIDLPICTDCHSAHKITEVVQDQFMTEVTGQCGTCHEDLSKTYLETMHGKAYQLGYLKSAKCSDCHNSHYILESSDPNSSLGMLNIVTTCRKCHEDANQRFTGYLTHATHHDSVKYPILFYTYWAMTILLISVFSFFGIHTLLWFPRSFKHLKARRKQKKEPESEFYFRRFSLSQRVMHLFVIISFMLLALTGMMLKFSGMPWAGFLSNLIGGVRVAGLLHRFAALITFGYFFIHVYVLIKLKVKKKMPW
ncbi:MAG: cytochrome c3 family protein, partial [Calditrichia bacterium]|nr:cytochrome c3 family protein [Calditrichia bacterium]